MSTDLPDGNDGQRGTTSGRTPRLGDARSPVGSTLSVVLAVLAVVAGFLILRELTDDDGGGNAGIDGTENTEVDDSTAGAGGPVTTNALGTATTSTTQAGDARTYAGATIAVANVSGQGGSASAMSSALETAGYQGLVEPGNGTGAQQDTSNVYFVATDAAARAVAQAIALDLGGVPTAEMPATRPASGGATDTATVLVMLGADAANKSLSELSGATAVAANADTTADP